MMQWELTDDKTPEDIATTILQGKRCLYTDREGHIQDMIELWPLNIGDIVYCNKTHQWFEYQ